MKQTGEGKENKDDNLRTELGIRVQVLPFIGAVKLQRVLGPHSKAVHRIVLIQTNSNAIKHGQMCKLVSEPNDPTTKPWGCGGKNCRSALVGPNILRKIHSRSRHA